MNERIDRLIDELAERIRDVLLGKVKSTTIEISSQAIFELAEDDFYAVKDMLRSTDQALSFLAYCGALRIARRDDPATGDVRITIFPPAPRNQVSPFGDLSSVIAAEIRRRLVDNS